MPDYKQGKIYTVRCKTDNTLIYVGCTTQSICVRMAKHRYDSMKRPNNFFIRMYVCMYVCVFVCVYIL
jgi:predicted GIY-YIG superfamily endonuclease